MKMLYRFDSTRLVKLIYEFFKHVVLILREDFLELQVILKVQNPFIKVNPSNLQIFTQSNLIRLKLKDYF